MRKEGTEEQFSKESMQGWRSEADAARIIDDKASNEDRKHTSGGVFLAIDSTLGAVVDKEEGSVHVHPRECRRFTQSWANVRGGMRIFYLYF